MLSIFFFLKKKIDHLPNMVTLYKQMMAIDS
jgi:hypothetical protein